MKKSIFPVLIALVCFNPAYAYERDAAVEDAINTIISEMTLWEKAAMLGGDTTGFDSKPLKRLGIPAFRMTDGPNGVRWGKSTAFPVGVCIAATWDPALVYQLGQALGRETKAQGRNVLLGPCVNIHRDPHAGRNFESFGEDPFLSGQMAMAYVKGVQSEKVVATTKHFVANNQEFERNSIDAIVDERVLREIYLPAFRAAVEAGGTWAIMSAYNRINGHYASSHTDLLTDILKDEWGFQGFVMSDWGAVHSVVPTMYAGLDIEMPNGKYMSPENVIQAIEEGRMKESKVDDKVRRMLRTMFAMDYFASEIPDGGALHTDENVKIAHDVAAGGIVLLKNDGDILPITSDKISSVAILGPNAGILRTGGGGSSRVDPLNPVSPLEAFRAAVPDISVTYSPGVFVASDLNAIPVENLLTPDGQPGLRGHYYGNAEFSGTPLTTAIDTEIDYFWGQGAPEGVEHDYFSIRWTGQLQVKESGRYIIAITSDDGSRLYIDDELLIDNWGDHAMATETGIIELEAGVARNLRLDFYEHAGDAGVKLLWQRLEAEPLTQAVAAAESSDAAVLFVGFSDQHETEGRDRSSNALPDDQIELINAVTAVNSNVVVVLNSGAGILMSDWQAKVPGILQAWYPGEQGGVALAEILLGNVNPSGKLVTTFFRYESDLPTMDNYPGSDDELHYAEGLFVGYRHYDKYGIAPLFPFGHGLSYTTFEYSDLEISPRRPRTGETVRVSLQVTNTGELAGAEVVQLYLGDDKSSLIRPARELKAFHKLSLAPGESRNVELVLAPEAMMFWDPGVDDWKSESGKFSIFVGSSSRDIRLEGRFHLR